MLNELIGNPSGFLTDLLLVATPAVQDGCFNRSVIYICAHNPSGAMGVMVNSLLSTIDLDEVLEQLEIPVTSAMRDIPVHFGGPVEAHRGFVLHSNDVLLEDSLVHPAGIALTANINILRDIAAGKGPKYALLTLGYAGWSPGQLESEIEAGSWIVAPATPKLVFGSDNEVKWSLAAASLGISDVAHLSPSVGHA